MDQLFRSVPRSEWREKSSVRACEACQRSFTLLTKPAHCNACGRVMCPSCLERQLTLPGQPGSAPVVVCHGCAVSISKAQSEAEAAYHQRRTLMEMLSAQQAEAGRLLELSTSLRGENEELLLLVDTLRATNAQLEGAAKKAESERNSYSNTTAANRAHAEVSPLQSSLGSDTHGTGSLVEQLQKKQKLLDVREATLQEALKKVSGDAERVTAQRQQLQITERELREKLAQEMNELLEVESRRLQDIHLEELAALGEQFTVWVENAAAAVQRCNQATMTAAINEDEKRQQQTNRKKEEETEKENLQAEKERNAQLVEELRARLAESQAEVSRVKVTHEAEVTKWRQRLEEDTRVLQAAADVRQRQTVTEHTSTLKKADERTTAFEEECAELREKCAKLEEQCKACNVLNEKLEESHAAHEHAALLEAQCEELREKCRGLEMQFIAVNETNKKLESQCKEFREECDKLEAQYTLSSATNQKLDAQCEEFRAKCRDLETQHKTHDASRPDSNSSPEQSHGPIEDEATVKKLRRELTSALRLVRSFEERATQSSMDVLALKREASSNAEETQKLRERLSRTEKALMRASGMERRLAHELQKRQTAKPDTRDTDSGSAAPLVAFAMSTLSRAATHADGYTRLMGEAFRRHYDIGIHALQAEWAKRHELTRRNTRALEQTTASIKAFQDELKSREDALRSRERDLTVRRGRLLRLSKALQAVARRLREHGATVMCEQAAEETQRLTSVESALRGTCMKNGI